MRDKMFIHIGNDNVIRSREIVTIIEQDVLSSSSIMEEMMQNGREDGIVMGTEKGAKSVVITTDYIYYSTLSVSTLKKRSGIVSMIHKLDDGIHLK